MDRWTCLNWSKTPQVNEKCDVVMKLSVFGTQTDTHTHKPKPTHPRYAGCNKLGRSNVCHHTKFPSKSAKRFQRYCDFSIFKIATVRHLGFSIFFNFWFPIRLESWCASPYQISSKSDNPFLKYSNVSFCDNGGCLPFCTCEANFRKPTMST